MYIKDTMFRVFLLLVLFFSTSDANFSVEEECLNYTVYPIEYELTINPYVYKEQSHYHCDIVITVLANANVQVIELDAKDLVIQQGSIKVMDGNVDIINGGRPYEYDEANGKLYIYLREPLRVYSSKNRQFYYIKLSFNKLVKEDSGGLFLVKYYEDNESNMKYLFTTRLSPNKAKYFFPCFDNPRFETVFKFRVYVSPEHSGMQYTNTSIVISQEFNRVSTKDNYTIIEYNQSPQICLHQVGFHYSTFASNRDATKNNSDAIIIWAPGNKLQYYEFILNFGNSIINHIHKYSTIKRPILNGPINIVAVPADLNGYEIGSWNLLTNGANRIVYVEGLTSIRQIERMTFELAQQLCRIWLGNPGEPERTRWREEWFKEGVATYLAYYFLVQYNYGITTNKFRESLDYYGLKMKHKAMAVDWHRSTPALETFNNTLAIDIPARYKELVTMKTGALLWMLENWLGSERFHQAFVKYINSRRGKYISLQDFMISLDIDTVECSYQFFNGSTSSRILKSWFHRPGYPVIYVHVLRDRIPNVIQLKQRQFSFTKDNRRESEYLIPISYLIQNRENCFNCYRPRFTIGGQTYTFVENLNGGWIILNRNASGYYRVNYDTTTWLLIAKTLREDFLAIDEMNRAQIVNDVLALYVAGDMEISLAFEVIGYLDKEWSPIVWDSVIEGFELLKIEGASCNITKHLFWEWEDFMRKKVTNVFNQLVKNNDKAIRSRVFRSKIINFASVVNYEPCLTYLHQRYDDSRRGREILDPDNREACYYVLSNDTHSYFEHTKLNSIEQEDRNLAQHKVQAHKRFFIKIPHGERRPLPLILTEKPITQAPVTEKITSLPNKSSTNIISLFTIFITLMLHH